jgi:molybdopterin-synthase adenylyltransferase
MKLEIPAEPVPLALQRIQLIDTEDGIVIKRGRAAIRVDGREAADVARSILELVAESPIAREHICERFLEKDRPAIDELVRSLETRRILTPATGGDTREAETPLDVFYWHFGKSKADVSDTLGRGTIAVVGVNEVSRQLVRTLMAGGATNIAVVDYQLLCNVRLFGDDGSVQPTEWPDPLPQPQLYRDWVNEVDPTSLTCVVATSDFGGAQLMRAWNRFCVERGCHFLPVILQDLIGYVGPLVIPRETACFECARGRQNSQMNNPAEARLLEHVAFEGQGVNGFHPAMASVVADIAAMELTKVYGGFLPRTGLGRLIEVNLLSPQLVEHRVLKLPRCEVCSNVHRQSPTSFDKSVFLPGHPVAV